jgi:L-ascorbate metabolism protein UlaG (beta-lactamase superfamily)
MQLLESAAPWPDTFPSPFADKPPARNGEAHVRITYVGHASFLLQARGLNILVDPVWSDRASPVSFAGPKRVNPPGIAFDDLPPIDWVLVTHNHYDHLDLQTARRLWHRHRPRFVAPLGNDAILREASADIAVWTGDWDETHALSGDVRVHLEPTHHWSARGVRDRRHALWASYVVEAPGAKIYCVGDSGFGDGRTFRRVAGRHPDLALALLPIGAYEPRWFMAGQHMNPEEAVAAFELSGARTALGHHWGTFKLTHEPIDRPPADLAEALFARGVAPDRFRPLRPGEVTTVVG